MATAAPVLRIGPADHGRTMSLEEFLDADETPGFRYELARGVLEVTYVPGEPHALIVHWFYCSLAAYELAHPRMIFRFGGASEFRLWLPSMISGRNPDVGVAVRNSPRDPRGFRRASLAIEVVSEGEEARTRDYVTKREEYLAYGLLEYWIVDHFTRTVTVLIRDGDAWVERVFGDGQSVEGLVLPGFAVPVLELWESFLNEEETPA